MKAVFKTGVGNGAFIRTTVAPSQRTREPNFSLVDGVIMVALVFGLAAVMRLVLAN